MQRLTTEYTCSELLSPDLDRDMYTDTPCVLKAIRAKRMRSPVQVSVSTPKGARCQAFKRQRALQPLPGLHIACHSARAAEAAESCLVNGKRPSAGTTPTTLFGKLCQTRAGPESAALLSSPIYRVESCIEPYVSVGTRLRADSSGPGPSVLAHSSSVLSPVDSYRSKPKSHIDMDAADLMCHDEAQHSSVLLPPPTSLGSSLATLQLTSLDVDRSFSSLIAQGSTPERYDSGMRLCHDAVSSAIDQSSPCCHLSAASVGRHHITPCPTIITEGSNILEVSPRSLVTPCKSQPPPGCSRQHAALLKDSSTPARTSSRHPLRSTSYQGVARCRRIGDSPSDDDAGDSPLLPGGLLTPQCMPAVTGLQCRSPTEHPNAGSAGCSSAGRLVCNLIERFNNTQLYDGINESPQLAAAHLMRPGTD